MSDIAYKLVDRAEWEASGDPYAGSAVDRADGYIHLSTSGQLAETAARHYRDRGDLLLVAVDLSVLGETLKLEPSRGGDLFPHIHGVLPHAAVPGLRSLSVDEEGVMRFDDGAVGWP